MSDDPHADVRHAVALAGLDPETADPELLADVSTLAAWIADSLA